MILHVRKRTSWAMELIPGQLINFAMVQAGKPLKMSDYFESQSKMDTDEYRMLIPVREDYMRWPYKPYFALGHLDPTSERPVYDSFVALNILDDGFANLYISKPTWYPDQQTLDGLADRFSQPALYPDLGLEKWAGKITLWEEMLVKWNVWSMSIRLNDCMYENLISGDVSSSIKNNPSYVPINTPIPHWKAKERSL